MKVIRDEDKNSNKYIMRFEVEKGTIQKNTRKNASAVEIKTEDYNNLVVYMADGSKPRYENVPEYKVRLLELMREQHARNKEVEILYRWADYLSNSIGMCVGGIFSAVVMATITIVNPDLFIANFFQIGIPGVLFAYASFSGIKAKILNNKLKEIKKNDYLLENEEVLNEADLENENILENIKDKDKAVIAEIKEEKDKENDKHYFDINSVDKLSLDALRRIKANIERENYLGLVRTVEETKGDTESKGNSCVKK